MDWGNPDIRKVVEFFDEKFDRMRQEKDEIIDRQAEENRSQADRIKQLEAMVLELQRDARGR